MIRRRLMESRGQTLGLVALLMVVILIFLALAIDVGLIYQQRRGMQNAADAGALAAARAYCFGGVDGGYGTVEQAIAAGEEYAITRNVADDATVMPSDGNFVWTVRATKEVNLVFADIVGLPTMTIGAVAAAKCGMATGACGLWPIAFSLEQWSQVLDAANCPTPSGVGGTTIYIWTDKLEKCDPLDPNPKFCCECEDPADPSCDDPDCYEIDCDKYDCDLDGDGVQDVFTDYGRAWVDFSGYEDPDNPGTSGCPNSGCGTDELGDCLEGSASVKIEDMPVCLGGDTGVRVGTRSAVESRAGEFIGIPIFDEFAQECASPTNCPESYTVVDFGCIRVEPHPKSFQRLQLKPKEPGKPWNGWVIAVRVACGGCSTNCGSTSGNSPDPGEADLRAVSLIR